MSIFVLAAILVLPQSFTGGELRLASTHADLDREVSRFEKENSESAVIIMEPADGRIRYVYNPEVAFGRKFPPGSLAKLWSAVVFMENQDLLGLDGIDRTFCSGKYFITKKFHLLQHELDTFNLPEDEKFRSRYFRCSIRDGHGNMDLYQALVSSCNVYFLTRSAMNPETFFDLLYRTWHFEARTEAMIGEAFEAPSAKIHGSELTPFEATASAIGEGGNLVLTPLKVAQTYAAFLADTPLLVPQSNGAKKPLMQFPLKISPANRRYIYRALKEVLKTGTLKDLKTTNPDIGLIAGKSGSATWVGKKFLLHGWNVVYFSYQDKNFVMVTFVLKGTGAREALSLSRTVLDNLGPF